MQHTTFNKIPVNPDCIALYKKDDIIETQRFICSLCLFSCHDLMYITCNSFKH